jgi:glycosyltransferase involved in cell wall biosynthesis
MQLTIAIPTFNRAENLDDLLSSIAKNWRQEYFGRCDIHVFDNASTDKTEEVLKKYQSKIPLFVQRNLENLGLQRNWRECIKNSKGQYCWIIGDDEEITTNSISVLLEVIENIKPSAIVGNYCYETVESPPFLRSVRGNALTEGPALCEDFVSQHGLLWTFGNFGMVVVKRDLVASMLDLVPQYYDSTFAQAFFYYEAFFKTQIYFTNQVLFLTDQQAQGPNKDRWHGDGTYESWHSIPKSIKILLGRCHPEKPLRPLGFFNFCSCDWLPMWLPLFSKGLRPVGYEPELSLSSIIATKEIVDQVEPSVYTECLKSNLFELHRIYKVAGDLLSNRGELTKRLHELSSERVVLREISLE